MLGKTLNCPMCGAPASTDSPACEHCGARLATIACPSCFGMMFLGAKFCSHCGAKADRTEVAQATTELCPRCQVDLNAVVVGNTNLRECPRCEGVWVNKASVEQICADTEKQSAVLGMAAHLPTDSTGNIEANIRYLPCPVCAGLMNRVNFAHCSHVIVDVCAKDGTWFDRDELRGIVEFIRAGGFNQARVLEAEELKSEVERLKESRERLQAGQSSVAWEGGSAWGGGGWPGAKYDAIGIGVSAAAQVLKALFRK